MTNQESNHEALIIHIEGLQAVLIKRNLRIAELEEKLANPELINNTAVTRAYRRGFKECASRMMDATRESALLLKDIRKDAFELYLEGDKL